MKNILLLPVLCIMSSFAAAQIVCDSSGNLMIYTNYDGGTLSINVDVDIPNLKIGIVSYEGTTIILGGPYANNVTSVSYAGMNSSNPHCGSSITTSFHGVPPGADTSIVYSPLASLTNTYGNAHIICGYSCATDTYQGGCNTIDQIEDYFLDLFPGSVIYAHMVQYGCWTIEQLLSSGGSCCGLTTSIPETDRENTTVLYPNPCGHKLYIQSPVKAKSVICYNNLGQSAYFKPENNSIDVTSLGPGMYLLKITLENGEEVTTTFAKE